MHPLIAEKLSRLSKRYLQLGEELSRPDSTQDLDWYREHSKEYSSLKDIHESWLNYQKIKSELIEAHEMFEHGTEAGLRLLAQEELQNLHGKEVELEKTLYKMLIPKDKNDENNTFLEIRMGTGGDEAAIFAGDLYRMYHRYCERQGWSMELLSTSSGEHGGYREIISRIVGKNAFSRLKFESGGHRVQRVPETEAQGRIHTSAATVAVMPELEELKEIEINPADIRIDTFRSSGAGGQHVNKTDSAIRITHLPTGIVVECQNERSQHKNKSKALSLLVSRLHMQQDMARKSAQAQTRKSLIGSGDRSERIRTYNFPQGRVTDHRINLTLYKIDAIMDGDLEDLVTPLMTSFENEEMERTLDSLKGV
ncbi:MAG: peptide chain release factor 1 [Methylacidiphilales bacterium]|nr:peptide chain release factor 1 [Candidatus Methylacidiphilales bacterium]